MRLLTTLTFLLFTLVSTPIFAQKGEATNVVSEKPHKIVIQLTSSDTAVHKGLMKQLNNITSAAPLAEIEVVCHGPGIQIMVKEKTIVSEKMEKLVSEQKVSFIACENTLREKKIDKSTIVSFAQFAPAGIIYIVERQEAGWSYIKAGN